MSVLIGRCVRGHLGGAVVRRTTKAGEKATCSMGRAGFATRSSSSRAAGAPSRWPAWSTVVKETAPKAAKVMLS
jgi:hypothetical protein